MHRADLLAALAGAFPAERVHLDHRLVGLTDHGDHVEADLLVGADGIHCVVRGELFGPDRPATPAASPTAGWSPPSGCATWSWR
jgi:salicylate hydroxylase